MSLGLEIVNHMRYFQECNFENIFTWKYCRENIRLISRFQPPFVTQIIIAYIIEFPFLLDILDFQGILSINIIISLMTMKYLKYTMNPRQFTTFGITILG